MRKMMAILAMTALFGAACLAQNDGDANQNKSAEANTPKKFYKLDFVVREVENGRVTNSRSYSLITRDDERDACSVRANSKVPYLTGRADKAEFSTTAFQQVEVGVSIDCQLGGRIAAEAAVKISAEIATMVPNTINGMAEPIIRQNRWHSWVIVPLGQPTIVYTSDDLDSKGAMQLQLTVTPVK